MKRLAMLDFDSQNTYDHLSQSYEKSCGSYWGRYGFELVNRLGLRGGENVLDVACGTGSSALPAAQRVGPRGTVLAVDSSSKMIAIAENKARTMGLDNVRFVLEDMRNLALQPGGFDRVVCAFGIFFLEDMPAQISKLWALVRPGGQLWLSVWGAAFLAPMYAFWKQSVCDAGQEVKVDTPWERTHAGNIGDIMRQGGVADASVTSLLGRIDLTGPDTWWGIVTSTGLARYLQFLTPQAVEAVRLKNRGWLQERDITSLTVDVVYASASKPQQGHG